MIKTASMLSEIFLLTLFGASSSGSMGGKSISAIGLMLDGVSAGSLLGHSR